MLDLGPREAFGNMLRAIPVKACDFDDNRALGGGVMVGAMQLLHEFGIVFSCDDARAPVELQSPPICIVHEEKRDLVIAHHVPCRNILPVAAEVRIGERSVVECVDKARRPAAKLYIGPARFRHSRLIEAVALNDEFGFCICQDISGRRFRGEKFRISASGAVMGLKLADALGKSDFGIGASHGMPLCVTFTGGVRFL